MRSVFLVVGTNSRNGAERNGTELRSKTRNSGGTIKTVKKFELRLYGSVCFHQTIS